MPRVDSRPPMRYPRADVVFSSTFARAHELASVRHESEAALLRRGASEHHAAAVVLVLSELATNALCHAAAPYGIIVKRNRSGITVLEVTDAGEGVADSRNPELQHGGYGLNLVNQLSDIWGVYVDEVTGAKIVWATLTDVRRL